MQLWIYNDKEMGSNQEFFLNIHSVRAKSF